jgi:multiple sugar transport system substrate-binding protein
VELNIPASSRLASRKGALALFMTVALVVTACGGGGGGGGTQGPGASGGGGAGATSGTGGGATAGPTQAAAFEPPASDVSRDFWTPFSGADGDQMEKMVEQFNSETPSVQIALRRVRNPDYYPTVNNAIQAQDVPEIMIMHIDALARYAGQDQLEPVTDLVETLGLQASDFTEAVWNGTMWKDQQYSIPLDVHPQVLYFDRGALEEAGVAGGEPPTDQASFEDALQKCKDAGKDQGVWGNHAFSAGLTWVTLFYQLGGEWVDADYNVTVNSEAGVQAAEYMRGLIDKGLQPAAVDADAELSNLEAGTACFATTGIWQTARLQASLEDNFGEAPMPQIFGPGVWAGSHTMAIKKGLTGDEKQGAYYFMDWVSRNSVTWASGGQLPARTEVRESAEFQAIPDIADVAAQAEDAKFPPPIPGSGDIFFGPGGVYEKLGEYLQNGGDAKAGLDAAAQQYTQIIQDTRTEFGF